VLAWSSALATLTIERRADGLHVTVERHLTGFVPAEKVESDPASARKASRLRAGIPRSLG